MLAWLLCRAKAVPLTRGGRTRWRWMMKGCVWRHPSRWGGLLLWLLLLPLCCTAETAAGERGGGLSGLSAEDRINLLCLRSAYPQIRTVESGPDGIWLRLEGERRVLYASAAELAAHPYDDAT